LSDIVSFAAESAPAVPALYSAVLARASFFQIPFSHAQTNAPQDQGARLGGKKGARSVAQAASMFTQRTCSGTALSRKQSYPAPFPPCIADLGIHPAPTRFASQRKAASKRGHLLGMGSRGRVFYPRHSS
jgi:hypothetical protein